MNTLNIAIDLGFGYTKAVAELNGKIYKISFPSVVKRRSQSKKFAKFFSSDDYIVKIKNTNNVEEFNVEEFAVGEKAITDGAIRQHTDKMIDEQNIKVLILTATHVLLEKYKNEKIDKFELSLGLPLDFIKDELIEKLTKIVEQETHIIEINNTSNIIQFTKCNIYAQGIGAYYDTVLDWNGDIRQADIAIASVGYIVVGYNTVEVFALVMGINGLNIVEHLSETLHKKGINLLLTEIQSLIYGELGITVNVELIERAILHKNNLLETQDGVIDITNYLEQSKKSYIKTISSEIKRIWGNNEDTLRYKYLAGASSSMLYPEMKENFKNLIQHGLDNKNEIRKDACIFANANGYIKMQKNS